MKEIKYKDTDLNSIKDVDVKTRRIKAVLNRTGVKDSDNDIIDKSAFTKTISERGPKGKNLIYHLVDHSASLTKTLSKFSELYMEGDDFVGVSNITKNTFGDDMLALYDNGTISQHSIGFNTIKHEIVNENEDSKKYTIIKEVKLWEGSAVVWGANEFTPTLSVGKSLLSEDQKLTIFKNLLKQSESFSKVLKSGKISDETGELLELYIKQIDDAVVKLFSPTTLTEPAKEAVQPIMNDAKGIENNEKQFDEQMYQSLLLIKTKLQFL